MYIEDAQFQNIITLAVEEGIRRFLARPKKDIISERKAKDMIPTEFMKAWLAEGLISYQKNGTKERSRKNFSYSEILRVAASKNVKLKI